MAKLFKRSAFTDRSAFGVQRKDEWNTDYGLTVLILIKVILVFIKSAFTDYSAPVYIQNSHTILYIQKILR